ncbi:MAG: hypothetical protein JJU03_05840 [Idiomarina sp.]|nr:hypothetical protein [Idiomarina sp.]
MKTKLTILSAMIMTFGLAACSDNNDEQGDIDAPRYSAEYADDAAEREQEAIEQGESAELSRDELVAGLQSGEINLETLNAGYSADTLLGMIRQELRPARASSPEQCKVIAVGSKPCGGPERYMMYSTETTDEDALRALVRGYNAMRKRDNERDGMVSDCQVVPKPAVVLQNGMCRLTEMAEY